MPRQSKKNRSHRGKATLPQHMLLDDDLRPMTPQELAEWEGRTPGPEWLQEHRQRDRRRAQKIERAIDRMRARGWINFRAIADWCAREPDNIDPNERKRALAYSELWKGICAGEFGNPEKPLVYRLDPSSYPQRLSRKIGEEVLRDFGEEALYAQDFPYCWAPGDLCRRWAGRRNLCLPPHLFPPGKTRTATQAAGPGEKGGEASRPGPPSTSADQTPREQRKARKKAMYNTWYALVEVYRCNEDGTPRHPNEIARRIAADPQAKDPKTKKPPVWNTVLRRLNRDYPDWKADGQKKAGQ